LAIAEKCDKLIVALRTAYANAYSLDKERTLYDDSLRNRERSSGSLIAVSAPRRFANAM